MSMTFPLRQLGAPAAIVAFAGAAVAAPLPPAVDYVPKDAAVFLAVDDLGQLLRDVERYTTEVMDLANMQGPAGGLSGVAEMIQPLQELQDLPGLNADGSAAIVIEPGLFGGEALTPGEMPEVGNVEGLAIVVPVDDYDAFLEGVGAQRDGDVATFDFEGETMYARKLGDGFAALAPTSEALQKLAGGNTQGNADRLGELGTLVSDQSDLLLYADVPQVRESLSAMLEGFDQAEQQMKDMGPMMGDQAGQALAGVRLMRQAINNFLQQGETGLLGLDFTDEGLVIDLASDFQDDSEIAGYFSGEGDAAEVSQRLPSGRFLAAYSFDASEQGLGPVLENVRSVFEQAMKDAGAGQQGGAGGMGGMGNAFDPLQQLQALGKFDGAGAVVGVSAAPMMTGFLGNTVGVVTGEDPSEFATFFREQVREADGQSAGGLKFTTTYTEDAQEIAGESVDTYTVQMITDPTAPENQMMAAMGGGMGGMGMVTQMLYGANGGPSGFVVTTDDAVIFTAMPSTPQLTQALKAAGGEGGLYQNPGVKKVADILPENRVFEVFVSADEIVNLVGPMMQMFGVGQIERAEPSAPIGLAASQVEGGVLVRAYLPDQAVKTLNTTFGELAPMFGGMMGGMGGAGDFGGGAGGADEQDDAPQRPRF